jgi:hypothetical protein
MATVSKISLVNTLAAQIRHNDNTYNRSTSMQMAWLIIGKGKQKYNLLVFRKKSDNKITRRVVSENWAYYQPPVGGKSNVKPGQKLFADLGKYLTGSPNCIISTFPENIVFYA